MALSIGEVAQQYDLSIPTLRYYEEQGLLPFIKRGPPVGVNSGKLIWIVYVILNV
ncbi:MerR family DNA-binding transcriptional regulator [Latilactobacillus sakei]